MTTGAAPPSIPLLPVPARPAELLQGMTLPDGWEVVRKVPRISRAAGGTSTGGFFSVPYIVRNAAGEVAFLKALDIAAAAAMNPHGGSPLDQLRAFTEAYTFERDLLLDCGMRGLSRIIVLVAHGHADVPSGGWLRHVPYLIFELADGDLNSHQAALAGFDLAWVLRALKHVAHGIEQLHSTQTAHQDLRPSNVLTQAGGREMKLGDLGRAAHRSTPGPNSQNDITGFVPYAPPEQLYGAFDYSWELRRAADIYHLGSIALQLFVGHSATSLLEYHLPASVHPDSWSGDFTTALPYLRAAHAQVIQTFAATAEGLVLGRRMLDTLVRIVTELTDPDPRLRGRVRDRPVTVRRYVSVFDRLAREAELALRGATGRHL